MDWSKLFPTTLNPVVLLRQLASNDHHMAMQALRDSVILLTLTIAAVFGILVLWQTVTSGRRSGPYLKLTKGGKQAESDLMASDLSLFQELRHHFVRKDSQDGTGKMLTRRTVDAAEVFRESELGPAFASSRLVLAIPSILTGLGLAWECWAPSLDYS